MASGHVNRTNRPNTWLHRPTCKREEKPCQLGAVHTWQILLQKSPIRSKAAQARKKLFLSFVPLAPRASGG
jgi:hypothetical protein